MPSLPHHGTRPRRTGLGSHLATVLMATLVLTACSTDTAAPVVSDPWIRSNPNGMGAAYVTITMPATDMLVAAEVDAAIAARVEVHEVIDDAGMMRMREVDGGVPLPAGEAVQLRPGGYHLMLLDMPEMLEVGSTVTMTLHFASADPIVIVAEVREGAEADEMPEHGPHDMQHGGHQSGHGSVHHGDSHRSG
jgi:copper(I)-binding protein